MELGALLSQQQPDKTIRPIAFASRTLQPHEWNYLGTGGTWSCLGSQALPPLSGHPCTVDPDHEALKSLLNTPQPSGKLAWWGMAIQELDLMIEYRPGNSNARADALSHYPLSLLAPLQDKMCADTVIAAIQAQDIPAECGEGDSVDTLSKCQRADSTLKPLITYLQTGELPWWTCLSRQPGHSLMPNNPLLLQEYSPGTCPVEHSKMWPSCTQFSEMSESITGGLKYHIYLATVMLPYITLTH